METCFSLAGGTCFITLHPCVEIGLWVTQLVTKLPVAMQVAQSIKDSQDVQVRLSGGGVARHKARSRLISHQLLTGAPATKTLC